MRIYTKKGDSGETGLLFGGRVSKADPRTDSYGSVDTAISAMGMARALCADPWVKETLLRTQHEMFTVATELATSPDHYDLLKERFSVVTAQMVEGLEKAIDEIAAQVTMPKSFIVPGASAGSGALDLARALVREAERRVVALSEAGQVQNPEVLRYLNRLSDLLFMLARLEDRDLPFEITTGEMRKQG
ncbi:MAG: cob(I)yrinic acid a,c-diamide adenosyltransferase [SAR202 cluster bacterium]|nr:cob(I)yrinic acid a,c-diamide adenosyltransferase [SAR202 cluster bacterium]